MNRNVKIHNDILRERVCVSVVWKSLWFVENGGWWWVYMFDDGVQVMRTVKNGNFSVALPWTGDLPWWFSLFFFSFSFLRFFHTAWNPLQMVSGSCYKQIDRNYNTWNQPHEKYNFSSMLSLYTRTWILFTFDIPIFVGAMDTNQNLCGAIQLKILRHNFLHTTLRFTWLF